MTRRLASRRPIAELAGIRRRFDAVAATRKLELVRRLERTTVTSAGDLEKYHDTLCYLRAFPDSEALFHAAHDQLMSFGKRVARLGRANRERLWDTGIAGTRLHYPFSYEVANWLAKHARGQVSIDWQEIDSDTGRLDELLTLCLLPVEADYFDSGYVSSREWIEIVSREFGGTDFDWLLAQLGEQPAAKALPMLYESADLPLAWALDNSSFSKSTNAMPPKSIANRSDGMRKPARNPKAEIQRPLASLPRLPVQEGRRLIDLAIASLAVRHRETLHFNYANPAEVFLADVGRGASVAVFGLREACRYPLECTMGYLILSNGVPIGYGGASIFFRQANTGVNIFDEYRGAEAAFLWVQVMRVYHHLVGCTRFIANPFQFGADNDEALKSGAYWFYYRLGYRSVSPAIGKLATREYEKLRRNPQYRSSTSTLRRLASCDMHLTLPSSRAKEFFDEDGFEVASMLATEALGAAGGRRRRDAESRVVTRAAAAIGIRNFETWSRFEQDAFRQLAPILVALAPESWPAREKKLTRALARAKGGTLESRYAKLLSRHEFLFSRLQAACQ